MSGLPAISTRRSAFWAPMADGQFPNTVVRASIWNCLLKIAKRIAWASSIPGSVSIITRRVVTVHSSSVGRSGRNAIGGVPTRGGAALGPGAGDARRQRHVVADRLHVHPQARAVRLGAQVR